MSRKSNHRGGGEDGRERCRHGNDGTKEDVEGRYTVVLEKRGDDWLIVHEHMSVPAPVAK